ncbi:MAG: pyridoxamine 5'-phosphate oxidase family protein [Clostridia bacterium]|nr:pyridoxamine 5'-phosphate oxidase family protein [Clostridia bacterium]
MNKEEAIKEGLKLAGESRNAIVGSIGEDAYPNQKCMFNMESEGLKTIWFGTNTSSKRVAQFRKNPKASVYFVDFDGFRGLMLVGDMEVLEDLESKKRLWREGYEMYYPQGVTDPDYCVLRFTAKSGNFYHGLENVSFEIE